VSFPLVNATLTLVEAPGSEEYDATETPATVWTGSARAYVREELREVEQGGVRIDVGKVTTIVVPADVGKLINADHRITFSYAGSTETRIVTSRTWVPELGRSRLGLREE
jgi:hypothetical protein